MNLLFDFLKFLGKPEQAKLKAFPLKGTSLEVWDIILAQIKTGQFNKEAILNEVGISASHFDKVTSELLSKCYFLLFGDDGLKLLSLLGNRISYLKHFYAELNRQVNNIDNLSIEEQKIFYKKCMEIILFGLPIVYRDDEVLKKLADKYQALFKGGQKKYAELSVGRNLLLARIDVLFAAGNLAVAAEAEGIEQEVKRLEQLTPGAEEELLFDFYWLKMYFYSALENFPKALEVVIEAIKVLSANDSDTRDVHVLRFKLKYAEFQYYLSNFTESFERYNSLVYDPLFSKIPDDGYQSTKYIQICLITGNVIEAGKILDKRFGEHYDKITDWVTPRDVFSFIKYYLFNNEYDKAFRFIQLGLEKNPKGKYFQYEVELRNLQVVYFFFTDQKETALDLCKRSIKYLRNHGYGISTSDYPYFHALAEAIIKTKASAKALSKKQQVMLDRYQIGSYGVYGKLLLKMLNS